MALKNNKGAGGDGIPAVVWKCGGIVVSKWLHSVISDAWFSEEVPQSWKDAELSLLWKGKGSRADLAQYRTVALLATGGKVLAQILQRRISRYAEESIFNERSGQWGFRSEKSTLQPISIVRRLQEHTKEKGRQLHLAFLDIVKAYDTVNREAMWKVMHRFGLPKKIINLTKSFHQGQHGRIIQNSRLSEPFSIENGLRQGCVLAPTLFLLFVEAVIREMGSNMKPKAVVELKVREDGDFFDTKRFRASTLCKTVRISHLVYVDDAVLVPKSRLELQHLVDAFEESATAFGLWISVQKKRRR